MTAAETLNFYSDFNVLEAPTPTPAPVDLKAPYIAPRHLLSDEFVAGFAEKSPPWGPFGEVTYLRSYSQYLASEGRYERWHETVRRVVEFSFALYRGPASRLELTSEAQRLFTLIWNLKGFPAGRTLWLGGMPMSYTQAGAPTNFNCAFTDIRELADYSEMVLLLMGGSGVGFRVTQDCVAALNGAAPFRSAKLPELVVDEYEYAGVPGTLENTVSGVQLYAHRGPTRDMKRELVLTVGDSREGWAQFVEQFLRALTVNDLQVSRVRVNVNRVRPLGSALKTFGGQASGPGPLIDFANDAYRVLSGLVDGQAGAWTDLKMLDIANMVGRMVVAGGTRRSAQIALGDSPEFAGAKTGNWWEFAPWRSQSVTTQQGWLLAGKR